MDRGIDKDKDENQKKKELQIKSSTAEYLTFTAANGDDGETIKIRYEDENIWLAQRMMATLYDVNTATISQHLKRVLDDNELQEEATIRNFLIVQKEGSRNVSRGTEHYNLQAITIVSSEVNNECAVQFRKRANQTVKDFTIKGWAMDDERLKSFGTKLTKDYFEKLLVEIRKIRLSERRFYQKIADIYATSLDYDPSAKATKRFFAAIQNKLRYAIHEKTAAELIVGRANRKTKNMGLTIWEGSPDPEIHKYDAVIAKNYLNEEELNRMQRIVSSYLDMAELQTERHIPMTMEGWKERLNGFLQLWDKKILNDTGKVSATLAKRHAESEFERYRIIQDRLCKSGFDKSLELRDDTKKLEK